ncbi:hypothetical protein [Demequina pelophila]|uniref:hypothetical protein n=1 Tax=Demequina pelophila TaxID=1638984 RepID=UPI0007806413|nr:hypothetical protein [Demequina pelophila]
MDAAAVVEERARADVAALGRTAMSTVRALQDFKVEALTRRAPRFVRGVMREAGLLRPWWDRTPVLMLVAPLTLALAWVFMSPPLLLVGAGALAWGVAAEPRLNRAERREYERLLHAYRYAAAEALYTLGDRRYRGAAGAAGFGASD